MTQIYKDSEHKLMGFCSKNYIDFVIFFSKVSTNYLVSLQYFPQQVLFFSGASNKNCKTSKVEFFFKCDITNSITDESLPKLFT